MKKLFGKVLVGAVGFMMAFGISAFAANQIEITGVTPNKETGKVTVSGTITGDATAPEATILVVPEDVSLVEVTDAQIKYIDQETAQSGQFSYDFVLTPGQKYTVYCGGTDIVSPDQDVIDLTASSGTTFRIVGKVTLVAGADATKVTAQAGTTTVNAVADGTYTLEVAPGTYEVVVGRAGYLYRTFKDVQVSDQDVQLTETALLPGELTGDVAINFSDLTSLLAIYETSGFDAKFDLDDSGAVNFTDLTALLSSYEKDYE